MNKSNTNFNDLFDVDYKTGTVRIKGTDTVVPSLRYDQKLGEIRSYGVKSFEKRSIPIQDDVEDYLSEIPETILDVEDDTKPDRDTLIEVNGKLTNWDGSDILKTVASNTNYRVSTLGYVMNSRGQYKSSRDNHKRKNDKHQRVDLYMNGVRQSVFLHRLVAEAFIPNPENLPVVHHIDHNPLNNRVDNLMWMSVEDHTKLHEDDRNKGTKEALSITVEMCNPDTLEVIQTFPSTIEAARVTGFSVGNISLACNGIYTKANSHIYKGFYWRYKQD